MMMIMVMMMMMMMMIIIIIIIIIINKNSDRCGNTNGEECHERGRTKAIKILRLCAQIQRMWNLQCMIIPIISGATGIVKKGLKKNCEGTLGKRSVASLQKTAVLGTSQIIRKGLQSET